MSNKDALQRYEPELPNPWYGRAAVVGIIADAHAHYEAQVRQLGGLARPDAQPPTDRALQLMRLVEQYGGAVSQIATCADVSIGKAASTAADLYSRINALAQEMVADAGRYAWAKGYMRIDDIGDEPSIYSLVIDHERMQDAAAQAKCWCAADCRDHEPSVDDAIDAAMKEQQR